MSDDRSLDVRLIQAAVRFVVGRRVLLGVVCLLAVATVIMMRGIFTVPTNETGAMFRFGKLVDDRVRPGIHFHWPSPVEKVVSRNTTEVRRYVISEAGDGGIEMVTGDENLIDIDVAVQYQVHDYSAYLTGAQDWEKLLSLSLEAALSEQVAGMDVDELLTTGKNEIQVRLREQLQGTLDGYGAGLVILSTRIIYTKPPREASSAFRRVSDSRSERRKRVSEAQSRRNERLSEARGQAAMTLQRARSEAEELVKRAQGNAGRFEDLLEEYKNAPATTRKEVFFDRLSSSLGKARILLLDPDRPTDLNIGRPVSNPSPGSPITSTE